MTGADEKRVHHSAERKGFRLDKVGKGQHLFYLIDVVSEGKMPSDVSGQHELIAVFKVGTDPQAQDLYPEFVLFERLFRRHGMASIITPPQSLSLRDGRLWCGAQPIDLVYNRLTDFSLDLGWV